MPTGDPRVIEVLNDVLTAELTAINQYVVHAEMCHDWGYERLHKAIHKESIEEMKHAHEVIERILYLNGLPDVQRLGKIRIGKNVPEMMESDANLELVAIERLNKGIGVCGEAEDFGTRELLERILEEEEAHLDWIEAQQDQIEQVGIQNYLAAQIVDA